MGSSAQDQSKKRGSKRRFDRNSSDSQPADWSSANAILMREAIRCVSTSGGAVRFGYSRDGGAYALGIYGDGDPYTEYIRPGESIDEVLLALIYAFDGDTGIDINMPIERPK